MLHQLMSAVQESEQNDLQRKTSPHDRLLSQRPENKFTTLISFAPRRTRLHNSAADIQPD